ncbi:head-tail connector protein [Bacteroides sp.]|uniref:head-tail connector protein n=1 Tax=Bacteroides sp. TaxID=29523 RepID=UPI0026094AC0|nr:head-tail connector protein [Bacteroides sp.]MDD3038262.1 head-tail connector protein [Bacteroides sp.]
MAQYVTLEELKQHLNIDFDTDNTYITELIEPVQLAIESYLNAPLDNFVKDGKIDRRIWHAIRILIANYYANRESVTFATPQVIPGHVELLLQPLKKYT